MKRFAIVIICILLLPLCACGKQQEELQEPANFYYCANEITYNSKAGVLKAEEREAIHFSGDLTSLLHSYLQGPVSLNLHTPIPADVSLVSCSIDENVLMITFNEPFVKLTGIKLTTACSAILMTVHDYSGLDTICVRVENSLLDDKDEFIISMDDILLLDSVEILE